MSFGGGRHLKYRCSQLSHTGIPECKQSKINRELLENLLLNCTRETVSEKENSLADIAALKTFDREVLSKVIDKVYVYGPDRVEIIW